MTAAPDMLSAVRAMQLADSGFPSGVFAFSWGIETALAERRIDRHSLQDWILAELHGRWHGFDRIAFAGGFRRGGADLADWFTTIDTLMPVERLRSDSVQAGGALFASARALGIVLDPAVQAADRGGTLHFAVLHGHFLAACGLDLRAALAVSALAMARGGFSAAVRLGATGAIAMQRALSALAPEIARLAADLPGPDELPEAFSPLSDIALMRPRDGRLFIN